MASYQDDRLIKKPFARVTYTKEQLDELRRCMDPDGGPMYFIENFMYVQHPTRGKQQLALYDYQRGLLDNYHRYRKSVNLLSRQSGKCCKNTTLIKVKNKTTGEIREISFQEFDDLLNHRSE